MGRSESDIKKLCPDALVLKGLSIAGSGVRDAESDIALWITEVVGTKYK